MQVRTRASLDYATCQPGTVAALLILPDARNTNVQVAHLVRTVHLDKDGKSDTIREDEVASAAQL